MAGLVSTRGIEAPTISYDEAILAGLAPDGGLYVPPFGSVPEFSTQELRSLKDVPYAELATAVKSRFIAGAIPEGAQLSLNREAYALEHFPEARDGIIAPVEPIGENLYLQNLSGGPTAAFKDFGLRSLAKEVNFVLGQRDQDLDILGATSGDTGSAAESAFRGLGRVTMFMLSPETGMSPFQRAQMGELSGDNIHNLSVLGRFDDCQDMVKQLKGEPEFSMLGAVNSINWGRIVAQVVYYFDAYRQVAGEAADQPIDVVVPTGNVGNALSAIVAREAGLPLRNIIVATNENNVMHDLIRTGLYRRRDAEITSSPSMDISKASNYERLVYGFFEGDTGRVASYMREFERNGEVYLQDYGLGPRTFASQGIKSGTSTHGDRVMTIAKVYGETGKVIDPHTADAVAVAQRQDREVPTVCLATAAPVKFEATIREAIGSVPERTARFHHLEARVAEGSFTIVESIEGLREYIRTHR